MQAGSSKVGLGESRYHSWGCHEVLMPNFAQFEQRKWKSEEFEIAGYRWRFLVFPRSDVTGKKEQYLSLFIGAVDATELPVDSCPKAQIWLSVVNHADPIKTKIKETSHVFSKEVPSWGFSQFMPFKEVLDGWLTPGGSLHLRVFIKTECKRRAKIIRSRRHLLQYGNLDRCGSTREVSSSDTMNRDDVVVQDMGIGSGGVRIDPVIIVQTNKDEELCGKVEDNQQQLGTQEIEDDTEVDSQDVQDKQDKQDKQESIKKDVEDEDEVPQGGVSRKELCVNDDDPENSPQQNQACQESQREPLVATNSGSMGCDKSDNNKDNSGVIDDDSSQENRNLNASRPLQKSTTLRKSRSSSSTVPQFNLSVECNIQELNNIKHQMNSTLKDCKVSEIHLIIKAAAIACLQVPEIIKYEGDLNSSGVNISLIEYHYEGRTQRKLGSLDKKGIPAIAALLQAHFSSKASELETNAPSFAIMDMRNCGLKECMGLLNPSHSAILCVGSSYRKIAPNSNISFPTINFGLSCNCRSVEQKRAATWMEIFKGVIEHPMAMLI
eukprot:TRINITY_DN5673_c1_g1_i11.p1 TRINITY_DN5673_c1_g1~~TRINITY_DN5673_c1_g1_i11.p1  ORF type:complete len:550 (-),score=34.74 TRINITY_DN5673_c1_g1_i11:1033-2682(-)